MVEGLPVKGFVGEWANGMRLRFGGGWPAHGTRQAVGRTSLQGVHGQRVAARREDLAHAPDLGVVWTKQLLAHKQALFQVLQGLKWLALLLHRSVHLIMLAEPLLQVLNVVGCHARHTFSSLTPVR
jgi:hypothetical protein